MTDIVAAPDDPAERLKWAKGLLRDFSSPEGRRAVSAAAIRAMARQTIRELDPSAQSKPNRTRRQRTVVDVQHDRGCCGAAERALLCTSLTMRSLPQRSQVMRRYHDGNAAGGSESASAPVGSGSVP